MDMSVSGCFFKNLSGAKILNMPEATSQLTYPARNRITLKIARPRGSFIIYRLVYLVLDD